MKKLSYIFIMAIIFLGACQDEIFDQKPLDKISDSDVWQSSSLLQSYVTQLYTLYPSNPFIGSSWHNWSDESSGSSNNDNSITRGTASRTNDNIPYWQYTYIRNINIFLENIKDAPISETLKKRLEGEVRVILAAVYFEKQKRYGGVPLVDKVLDPFNPIDEQYLERSKEEEIADFIDAELTKAIELLPDDPLPKGRINKWTAYALKARANLWSGSIAKYGTVQLGGLVGIPETRANDFYAKASAAVDAVISSNKYSLFNKFPDKSENYRKMFLPEDEGNSEVIFEKVFDGTRLGHQWDAEHVGRGFSNGYGSHLDPLLEFVMSFENVDGSTDQPAFGPANLYSNGFEPFQNKDPRLRAIVYFQGDGFAGSTYEMYDGLDPSPTQDPSKIISGMNLTYQGTPSVGDNSKVARGSDTGFGLKKYIVEEKLIAPGQSKTNWIIIRLAELYLTKAEAEFEMGNKASAANALNETRQRAGISLVNEGTITLNHIRNERLHELAYEAHRYWDLRRWRIAEEVLNHRFQGLRVILHHASGKYYLLPINAENFSRVFRAEHYYNPITNARIDNNPALVENPLY